MLIFSWRDIVEILFFSFTFYHVSRWLYQDKTKPLLRYFYGYLTLILCAYVAELSTITYCAVLFSPALIMLFIVLHQETLQRNIVALKALTAPKQTDTQWMDALIRSCLVAINANKPVQFILEHSDDLGPFVHAAYSLDAKINEDLLCFIIEHSATDPEKMIWLNQSGYLKGVNVFWKNVTRDHLETALFYTEKTDSLILSVHPITNTVTLLYDGQLFSDITVHHAAQVLNTFKNKKYTKQEGKSYETINKSDQPRHPSA